MPNQLTRIPLAWPIGTRSGTTITKDPYIFNMMLEKYGDIFYVVKRPGTDTYITLGSGGTSQGITYFNGLFYGVVDDVLYRQTGTVNVGTDGSAYTSAGTPQWAATQGMGACVFKNRMFLIGGVTNSAGIWSSVDGVNWVVNAGGQPWGFRNHPGVCVFKEQIWVMGGYNITLGTTFNDVWSSPNGTDWDEISPATGAITMWNQRTNHNVVATNNGMYVYGGQDTAGPGTYWDDCWYSADGVSWAQLNTACTGTARANASMFWFNNNLWIVGGLNAGGTALNDAWYSPDGITWTLATAAAFGAGRYSCYSTVYRNKMWMIGGINSASARLSDVYSSSDGTTWTLVTASPSGIGPRADGACLVFQVPPSVSIYGYQTMYIIGGDDGATTLRQSWYGNLNVALPLSFALSPTVLQQPYQFNTYINGQLLLLKNQSNAWVLQSGTLTEVTDENYPKETVPGLVVLNAFAYVMTPRGEIHNCKLENPFEWPSLDFTTADYSDDIAICLAKHLNYVVALSQYSTQFFFDNGANQPEGTPLGSVINANNNIGCAAAQSVATVDNSLFWVGLTRGGGRTVVRLDGLQISNISTPYVDKIVMATSTGFLQGFNYSLAGHQFYVLKTGVYTALVYDTTFKEWYEWDTFGYGDAIDNGNTSGIYLWSTSGGNLVITNPLYYTDILSGNYPIYCQTDRIDHGNTSLKYCGRVVLVGDTSTATPTITYSDNDYTTNVTAGTVNMAVSRPFLTRLGAFERRSWKPIQTDNYPARWQALEVTWEQGES